MSKIFPFRPMRAYTPTPPPQDIEQRIAEERRVQKELRELVERDRLARKEQRRREREAERLTRLGVRLKTGRAGIDDLARALMENPNGADAILNNLPGQVLYMRLRADGRLELA